MATPPEPSESFDPREGRVLILGGGYAGVGTARELLRRGYPGAKVALIDQEPTTTFRTELYKVSEALLPPPGASRWTFSFDRTGLTGQGVTIHQGGVKAIDLAGRTVQTEKDELPFDVLVLALGCVPAYYNIPGCQQNSFEVYTVPGALALAERLKVALPASAGTSDLGILIAGGGATGVELGCHLATTDWATLLGAPSRKAKVTVLTGPTPFLAGMPDGLVARARKEVEKAGVEIVQGGQVVSVRPGHVEFKDLTPRDTDVFVWCGGLRAPDIMASLPIPFGPGKRASVTPFLEVQGHPGVFALGDVSALLDPLTGSPVPSTAQAALEQAPVAAQNILGRIQDRKMRIFSYRPKGVAVSVGRGKAVAAVGNRILGGRIAGAIKGYVDKEYHIAVRGI